MPTRPADPAESVVDHRAQLGDRRRGLVTRRVVATVLTVLTAAGVAGCDRAAGRRGPVGNASASASAAMLKVGTCHVTTTDTSARQISLDGLKPVPCGEPHVLETYHVARFAGDAANRQSVPSEDAPEVKAAFADCEANAKEYLGGDWFTGRVYVVQIRPTSTEWDAGARFYRCDLAEVSTVEGQAMVARTGSVRDGLRGARPLASACYDYLHVAVDKSYDDMTPADCAGPHDAEFAGVFVAAGEAVPDAADMAGINGCTTVVAAYLGGTPTGMRVAVTYWGYKASDWARGDRRVRCYAAGPTDRKMKGSVKGIGNRAPTTV